MSETNEMNEYNNILGGAETISNNINAANTPSTESTDNSKWTGYVVENNDPLRLGRVQIRIIGVYDDIPDYLLPWAVPDIGFVGTMRGSFMVPETNTMLRGYFDKGDKQRPVYDSIAYSANSINSTYTKRVSDIDYPDKIVFFETNQGDYLTLNRKNGEFVFTHRTGAQMQFTMNGNINISTGYTFGPSELNITVRGNANIKSMGKTNITGFQGVNISALPGRTVELGNNPNKELVNNLKHCVICGVPHSIMNTQVKV